MDTRRRTATFVICLALLAMLLSIRQCAGQTAHQYDSMINRVLVAYEVAPFTRTLIISQARVESGTYTSKLFLKHNNLFGMKHPRVRPTKSLGPHGKAEGKPGYASYATLEQSVEDLLLWLSYYGELRVYQSSTEYVNTLKAHRYFGSPKDQYLKNVIYHNKQQRL